MLCFFVPRAGGFGGDVAASLPLADQEKSGACGTGCGDGHATPNWVPYSNLGCYTGTS